MDKNSYLIRLSVENMERLLEELVAQQRERHQCCRAVELPPAPAAGSDATLTPAQASVEAYDYQPLGPQLIPLPDPLAGQLDLVIAIALAAAQLGRSERQLRRYRTEGKLTLVKDDGEGRSGYWLSQVRRLYFDFYGKWPRSDAEGQ